MPFICSSSSSPSATSIFANGIENNLTRDRLAQLNYLGFVWDVLEYTWEEGFRRLAQYKKEQGDCLPRQKFKTDDGYPLGAWVNNQKQNKSVISKDRLKRLNKIGFVWDARNKKEQQA